MNIAILGGTGKEGAGLAARWALAGHAIIIGSRDAERAKTKAAELREATHKMAVAGESNAEAARQGTVIVIALPAQGLAPTLPEVRARSRRLRPVDVGAPPTAGPLEGITRVLATINRRYKLKSSGITITGL